MARKGPCHSLAIKLGKSQKSENLMRKQLIDQQEQHAGKIRMLKNAHVDEINAMTRAHGSEISDLKEKLDGVCALRDIITRYDDLFLAMAPANVSNLTPMLKCLATLRASLFEAAQGLGVQKVL